MRHDRGAYFVSALMLAALIATGDGVLAQNWPAVRTSAESAVSSDRAAIAAAGLGTAPTPSSRRTKPSPRIAKIAPQPTPTAEVGPRLGPPDTSSANSQEPADIAERIATAAAGLGAAPVSSSRRTKPLPSVANVEPEPTPEGEIGPSLAPPAISSPASPEPADTAQRAAIAAQGLEQPVPQPSARRTAPGSTVARNVSSGQSRITGPTLAPTQVPSGFQQSATSADRGSIVRTQVVFPEVESPTQITPDPPPLYMPSGGGNYRSPDLTSKYEDDAYKNGKAFLDCKMPMAALDAMMCTPSETEDIRDSKELAIGGAYWQLNLLEQARYQYCQVLNQSDNPYLRGLAQKYLRELDQSQCSREFFRGGASVATRYDSNPGILPTFNAVGVPFHAPACMGNQYAANLQYDVGRTDNSDLTLGYNLYGTENYNPTSNNFNINQNDVFMLYRRRGYWNSTPVYAGLYMGYQYMTVGGQGFLSRPIVNPYVTFQHDDRRSTMFYGDYGVYDYLGAFNPGGPSLDLDSRQGRMGVTFRRRLGEDRNLMAALGYQFQVNDSDGADYDFTGQSAIAYLLWNLPSESGYQAQYMVTAQYIYRDYSNIDSIAGYKRRDNEFSLYSSLLLPITQKLFLIWDVGVDDNGSNVSANRYDRAWTALSLEYRFPQSWAQRSRMIY